MRFDETDHKAFFNDLAEDGFHIFSRRHAKTASFYPNAFPPHPELNLSDIKEEHIITIRAFFSTDTTSMPRIDSGHIVLEVECVDHDDQKIFANILTELPEAFALSRGTSIELDIDEVLSVQDG